MTFRDTILYGPYGPDTPATGGGGGNAITPGTEIHSGIGSEQGFNATLTAPAGQYAGSPHADPTNAFLIDKEGQNIVNYLLAGSGGGINHDIGVINNIKDNPLASNAPQSSVSQGPNVGLDQLNYFQNKPLAPRSTFMNALQNWSFNVPMQNLWAIVFELPPILKPGSPSLPGLAGHDSRVDDILYSMGEFNKNAGRDMNARTVIKEASKDIFQRVAGCLFAQSVVIPGESVQMNWLSPHSSSSGGLVGFPTLSNRQQFTSLNIGFRETNLSFIDFVMRPWLILASHLGLTERHPSEGLGVKTDIHVIQFAKAGAALKRGSSTSGPDKFHTNVIPLLPRKVWRFKDCTPIRVPQGDYSYSETSIETKTVEFIYSHYEVRAPDFYIKSAMGVAEGFVDNEAVHHRPRSSRTSKAQESARAKIRRAQSIFHGNNKRRAPEDKSKELDHQKFEFLEHNEPEKVFSKHNRLGDAYGASGTKSEVLYHGDPMFHEAGPDGKVNYKVEGYTAKQHEHARKELKQHNKPEKPKKHPRLKSGYAGDNLGAEPGKREGYTGRQRAHAEYRHDTGNKRDSGADRILGDGYIENREKQTNDAELRKTWSLQKEMRPGPKVLKPSDKKMKPDHHSLTHSITHGTEGEAKEGPLGHVEDSSKETGHADKKLGHGKARKMPAAGGYRWNQGSKGLFGWL